MLATRQVGEWRVWVMGCLRDDVSITTAVPQIADDSLQCRSWQSRASLLHGGPAITEIVSFVA